MLQGEPVDTSPAAMLRLSKRYQLLPDEQQPYDYIVVLDFEATCEADRANQDPQELIEFPALLVNTRDERVVDEFHRLVKPTRKPQLSGFCMQLTGITQEDVDAADEFPAVIHAFLQWLESHGLDPNQVTGPSYICLTHGDWDLKEMLPRQMEMSDLAGREGYDAACLRRWINLNPLFDAALAVSPGCLPRTSSGVESMAIHLQMRFEGRPHSGIDDARNIARILIRLLRFGVRVTPVQACCHRCGLPGHIARVCPHVPALAAHMHQHGAAAASNGAHHHHHANGHHHHHPHHLQPGMPGMPINPAMVQPRPGDWYCRGCGALVFARRMECFQCGSPRATSGAAVQ